MIKHLANVEIFVKEDRRDCLGWITVMELADTDLWQILEKNLVSWSERKRLLLELYDGYKYLEQVGIHHYDLKVIILSNYIKKKSPIISFIFS